MTYEYVCTACGNEWEASQSISEPALKECPECRQATAKRQVSGGTGFVLKGGGWYSDLYSSPKPASSAKDGGESGDGKAAKTEAPAKAAETTKAADKPATATAAAKPTPRAT